MHRSIDTRQQLPPTHTHTPIPPTAPLTPQKPHSFLKSPPHYHTHNNSHNNSGLILPDLLLLSSFLGHDLPCAFLDLGPEGASRGGGGGGTVFGGGGRGGGGGVDPWSHFKVGGGGV